MKKICILIIALTAIGATGFAQQRAGVQQRIVKVQGQPHELLTKQADCDCAPCPANIKTKK